MRRLSPQICFLASTLVCGCSEARSIDGSAGAVPDASDAAHDASMTIEADTGISELSYELVSDGCLQRPIAPGYTLAPVRSCPSGTALADVEKCPLALDCLRASDCTAKPFGLCEGATSDQCNYPHIGSTCSTDQDCTELPEGVCAFSGALDCDPSGNCVTPPRRCHYLPLNQVCTTDEECDAAPNGVCEHQVWLTRCIYPACEEDADCPDGTVCACNWGGQLACIPAECKTSSDCPDAAQCIRADVCGEGAYGPYVCASAADECVDNDDCLSAGTGNSCAIFNSEHLVCTAIICD